MQGGTVHISSHLPSSCFEPPTLPAPRCLYPPPETPTHHHTRMLLLSAPSAPHTCQLRACSDVFASSCVSRPQQRTGSATTQQKTANHRQQSSSATGQPGATLSKRLRCVVNASAQDAAGGLPAREVSSVVLLWHACRRHRETGAVWRGTLSAVCMEHAWSALAASTVCTHQQLGQHTRMLFFFLSPHAHTLCSRSHSPLNTPSSHHCQTRPTTRRQQSGAGCCSSM